MNANIQENAFLDALQKLVTDGTPVLIPLTEWQLWQVLSTIQLACRHPEFTGPTRDSVEALARALGEQLVTNHPGLRDLWEHGWDSRFDA